MKVKDLKAYLDMFDDDQDVVIGIRQTYGSNFAIRIDDINENTVDYWWNDGKDKAVVITEGDQIGCVEYEEEEL